MLFLLFYRLLFNLYKINIPGIMSKHSIFLKQKSKYSNILYPMLNRFKYNIKNILDILIKIILIIKYISLFILNYIKKIDTLLTL